jgi:hypothetical protein
MLETGGSLPNFIRFVPREKLFMIIDNGNLFPYSSFDIKVNGKSKSGTTGNFTWTLVIKQKTG